MPVKKLLEFLARNGVEYRTIKHPISYTAGDTAEAAHIDPERLAKTVMVLVDGQMAMAVLEACEKIELEELRRHVGNASVRLASEEEFVALFPGVEPGAMPPFGNLYDMPVYVDKALTLQPGIAFNAGSHTELIEIDYADFERLVKPEVCTFAMAHATTTP